MIGYISEKLRSAPVARKLLKYTIEHGTSYLFAKSGSECERNIRLLSKKGHDCFYGYYDRDAYSKCGSFYVYHEWGGKGDIEICVCSSETGKIEYVSNSPCANFQQGSLATWYGRSVIYNTFKNGEIVSEITDGESVSQVGLPLQCISEERSIYASINVEKLTKLRPDYGYKGVACRRSLSLNEYTDGLSICDMEGNVMYFLSLDEIKNHVGDGAEYSDSKLNHACFSPDGSKLAFMLRTFKSGVKTTYLLVYSLDTDSLSTLYDGGVFSHYCWVSEVEIIAWCGFLGVNRYYAIRFDSEISVAAVKSFGGSGDGHPAFCKESNIIITDTYPDLKRRSSIYMRTYPGDEQQKKLASLSNPIRHYGEARCDLHPRFVRSAEQSITIDSVHEGFRGLYRIDL